VRMAADFARHAWLLVKTKEGVQEVESTVPAREPDRGVPLIVMPPKLAKLVAFTGEYQYEDDQYAVVPVSTLGTMVSFDTLPTAGGDGGDKNDLPWHWIIQRTMPIVDDNDDGNSCWGCVRTDTGWDCGQCDGNDTLTDFGQVAKEIADEDRFWHAQ